MSWWSDLQDNTGDLLHPGKWGGDIEAGFGIGKYDPSNPYRQGAQQNAQNAQGFAADARNNYNAGGVALQQQRDYLQGLASGQNSVSAEQLRQGLQQQLAQQQSMAAGASPNNAAMAARNAAMNMGRASYGMAGQQAAAGLQERNQANEALGQLNLGARGQDLQGTLGGYGAVNQGYGTALGTPQKGDADLIGGALGGLAGGLVKSDRRAKTDIEDGDSVADRALKGLKAFSYRYKNERDGKGKQFGPMAQDMEKAGLGHAVIDTPRGKYVDGAKAATASLGLVAALGARVAKLEGKK